MEEMKKKLYEISLKYGFSLKVECNKLILQSKNIDGELVDWIEYNKADDIVCYLGNTDNCNLWFGETRKDLTTDMLIEFVKELNEALDLKNDPILLRQLIDPEDWQDIANIEDASEDINYINN